MSQESNPVERLFTLASPPTRPVGAGAVEAVASIERRLGTSLPRDYRELVLAYGDGQWQGFWYLLNPFSENIDLNLLHQASFIDADFGSLWAERQTRQQRPESYPFPIWPEPGGILPWAVTDNGGRFFWPKAGPSSRWATVYHASRDPTHETYELSVGEIVWGAISDELPIFREEFEDSPPMPLFEALGNVA